MTHRLIMLICTLVQPLIAQPCEESINFIATPEQLIAGETIPLYVFKLCEPLDNYRFSIRQSNNQPAQKALLFLAGEAVPEPAETYTFTINDGDTLNGVFSLAEAGGTQYEIYWAAGNDTMSRIASFPILPGALTTLTIHDSNNNPLPDTLILPEAPASITLFASGQDQSGNNLGQIFGSWSGGPLRSQIYLDNKVAVSFTDPDQPSGWIVLSHSDSNVAADSIYIARDPTKTVVTPKLRTAIRTDNNRTYTLSGKLLQSAGSQGISVSDGIRRKVLVLRR